MGILTEAVPLAAIDELRGLYWPHPLCTGLVHPEGLPLGAHVMVYGPPGAGKSTFAGQIALGGLSCVYATAEESLEQVKGRLARIGEDNGRVYVLASPYLEDVLEAVATQEPELLVLDSIGRFGSKIAPLPGTLDGMVLVAERLVEITKRPGSEAEGMTVLHVGQINAKDRALGPRELEHLVDIVVSVTKAKRPKAKALQALTDVAEPRRRAEVTKNRYAAEIALEWEMTETGLIPVKDE